MKHLNYILVFALTMLLAACHKYEPIDPKEGYVAEGSAEEWKATMTIGEFLASDNFTEFGDVDKYPPRPRSYKGASTSNKNLGLFSVEDITEDITIVGRIVSTDVPGNIYKNIYLQDCANPDDCIKIAVDAGSVGGMYPIGQKIALKLKGLAVGKYARMPQIGVPYFNNAKEGMDDAGKSGWEIGRIPPQIFKEHVQRIGTPDTSKIVVKTMTIAEIKATADNYKAIAKLSSRLVRIENVHFVPYTWSTQGALEKLSGTFDCATDGSANTFAPTTGGIGYPQSRCFTTDTGAATDKNSMSIGTSEYAKFACAPIPTVEYYGSVTGMLSYYYDNGKYDVSPNKVWSVTINGLDALNLISIDDGSKWEADPVYYPAY